MKTREEIEAMSDEERGIATAELCGWKYEEGESPRYGGVYKRAGWISPTCDFIESDWHGKTEIGLLDYLNDLNAMSVACAHLGNEQHADFREALWGIITMDAAGTPDDFERAYAEASALQKNSALLMTLL